MVKYAITGASGGGKSTLIAALAAAGYATVPETGRQIVAEQVARQGTAQPWLDPAAFMDLLFERVVAAFDQVEDAGRIVFFDRSFLDAIAYGAVIGRSPPPAMRRAAAERRFETSVFVCPPWEEIYASDDARRHDADFARRDHAANVAAYASEGYSLIEIPRLPVPARATFMLGRLADLSASQPSNPVENR